METGRLRAGQLYAQLELLEGLPAKQWRRLEPAPYGGSLRLETHAKVRDLVWPGRRAVLERVVINGSNDLKAPIPLHNLLNTGLPELSSIPAGSVLEIHVREVLE